MMYEKEKIIVVSNRVPYNVIKSNENIKYKKSVGGLVTALDPIMSKRGGLWIGWGSQAAINHSLGIKANVRYKSKDEGYGLKFVNLTKNETWGHYHGFSNRTLWPLFHGFIFQSHFNNKYWKYYLSVNRKFASEVLEEISGNELIWIQDYHLTLLPNLLREKNKDLKLLFFLHIPFPNYEIFRVLPRDKQILKGMLGCNLIGFQTKTDACNFLTCCKEILNLNVDFERCEVIVGERSVSVKNFPISIDFKKFNNLSQNKDAGKFLKSIKKINSDIKLIISVERLDYTKGIKEKLLSIERFFEKYPKYKRKVIFIQICVPSRTKIREYISLKKEVDELVGRINGRFAEETWSPVIYIYKVIPQTKLISFYKASDICLVIPLRDGMNLVAKEYVSCKSEGNGVLILSEFAGAAEEMKKDSIMVNPYDSEEVADSINLALKMPVEERKKKIFALRKIVKDKDIFNWAGNFLNYFIKTFENSGD